MTLNVTILVPDPHAMIISDGETPQGTEGFRVIPAALSEQIGDSVSFNPERRNPEPASHRVDHHDGRAAGVAYCSPQAGAVFSGDL